MATVHGIIESQTQLSMQGVDLKGEGNRQEGDCMLEHRCLDPSFIIVPGYFLHLSLMPDLPAIGFMYVYYHASKTLKVVSPVIPI